MRGDLLVDTDRGTGDNERLRVAEGRGEAGGAHSVLAGFLGIADDFEEVFERARRALEKKRTVSAPELRPI